MAKFAPTVPIHIAVELQRANVLGDYHLLLAHDVVKHPAQYRKVYGERGYVIILDNSVCELGTAVDENMIRDAAEIIRPTCIVLPDVYLDCDATIESCTCAYRKWWVPGSIPYMIVPQGKSIREWCRCAEHFAGGFPNIRWWGIPRNMIDSGWTQTRSWAVETAKILNPNRFIHMLGFSDDVHDDIYCAATLSGVKGIDSAVPIRAAQLGIEMSLYMDLPPRKTQCYGEDWWDNAEYRPLMAENAETVRNWIAGTS